VFYHQGRGVALKGAIGVRHDLITGEGGDIREKCPVDEQGA